MCKVAFTLFRFTQYNNLLHKITSVFCCLKFNSLLRKRRQCKWVSNKMLIPFLFFERVMVVGVKHISYESYCSRLCVRDRCERERERKKERKKEKEKSVCVCTWFLNIGRIICGLFCVCDRGKCLRL